jgi:hypothetical protein
MRKFLIWNYNSSIWGFIKPNASDDTKVAFTLGSILGLTVGGLIAISAFCDQRTPKIPSFKLPAESKPDQISENVLHDMSFRETLVSWAER